MAKAVINLQKKSGGIVKISPVDGVGITEVTVPESGELATKEYVDSLKTIASGTATFNSTTNNINLTGIGIGVEIGDVIQISGAEDVKNNSEFTVEVITDNDNIIVNQAHANKGTSKNVVNRVSDTVVTIKLLAKWYSAPIGLGQGWVDVSSDRSTLTTYTGTPNRSIFVSISGASNDANDISLSVDNIIVGYAYTGNSTGSFLKTISSIIPKDVNYSCTRPGSGVFESWRELR